MFDFIPMLALEANHMLPKIFNILNKLENYWDNTFTFPEEYVTELFVWQNECLRF